MKMRRGGCDGLSQAQLNVLASNSSAGSQVPSKLSKDAEAPARRKQYCWRMHLQVKLAKQQMRWPALF